MADGWCSGTSARCDDKEALGRPVGDWQLREEDWGIAAWGGDRVWWAAGMGPFRSPLIGDGGWAEARDGYTTARARGGVRDCRLREESGLGDEDLGCGRCRVSLVGWFNVLSFPWAANTFDTIR
jgi:hypothetical protein